MGVGGRVNVGEYKDEIVEVWEQAGGRFLLIEVFIYFTSPIEMINDYQPQHSCLCLEPKSKLLHSLVNDDSDDSTQRVELHNPFRFAAD